MGFSLVIVDSLERVDVGEGVNNTTSIQRSDNTRKVKDRFYYVCLFYICQKFGCVVHLVNYQLS